MSTIRRERTIYEREKCIADQIVHHRVAHILLPVFITIKPGVIGESLGEHNE